MAGYEYYRSKKGVVQSSTNEVSSIGRAPCLTSNKATSFGNQSTMKPMFIV